MKWKLLSVIVPAGIFFSLWLFLAIPADGASEGVEVEPASAGVTVREQNGQIEQEASAVDEFTGYAFYRAEYSDRYAAYQEKTPDLDTETVIWHVNAGLDNDPYTAVLEADPVNPLLINKYLKLPEGCEPQELVEIHSGIMVTPGTAEAFKRMRNAAMRDGIYIEASLGYRSFERQQALFDTEEFYTDTETAEATVARPGFSEHHTGRALHIADRNYNFDGFDKTPEYDWLAANGADYGFILRYGKDVSDITGFGYEPYHFTFVGRDIALEMKNLRIETLEEYLARGLGPSAAAPIDDRTAVVIGVGYNGGDDSAGYNVAQRVRERLEREDIRVVISRDIENGHKASAFIGIGQAAVSGDAVAWFASDRPEGRKLAETVHSRLSWADLSAESRGVYEDDRLALMYSTEIPATFIEISDTYDLTETANSATVADAVSDAVIAYLGVRTMHLTFDDGPSAKNTPGVLDILNEKGAKATFFVIGEMVEANPELLKRIVAEGHSIGIHCNNHDYKKLYASVESFVEDFYKARKTIEEITGTAPVIYRFPGGSINQYNKEVYQQIIKEMDKLGFVYFDWNISAEDASGAAKSGELMSNINQGTRYRYAVLLMHDAYPNIAKELSEIIDSFSDYQIKTITGDTKPVQFEFEAK